MSDSPARLRLDQRFAVTGGIVMLVGMLVMGWWTTSRIARTVTHDSAAATALYIESAIAPIAAELAAADRLSAEGEARIRALLDTTRLGEEILAIKLWKRGGLVAYASDPGQTGRRFAPTPELREAWEGHVSAAFDDDADLEDAAERASGATLLEVYAPLRSGPAGEIAVVAEFYRNGSALAERLARLRLTSWAVVGGVALAIYAALFGIVRQGSLTIERQRAELERRLADLAEAARHNESLRRRIAGASRRASELNESYLRRISAELHDGPAQALAYASLRLDGLGRAAAGTPAETAVNDGIGPIRDALTGAMGEIRDICRGLSLPEIAPRPLPQVVETAVQAHERRSGTAVALDFAAPQGEASLPAKICVYRFVQEALANAWRHGAGAGQRVEGRAEGPRLMLAVSDDGPGFDPGAVARESPGLGLRGLRERIESLGGEFRVISRPGGGTRLEMEIDWEREP